MSVPAEAARTAAAKPVTVIEPPRGWPLPDPRELWAYRELLFVLAARDVQVRYKQTVLGAAWAIIQPVMVMVVFSIFFGRLAKMPSDGVPYPVFVYTALLPWTFFATLVTSSSGSVVANALLITKVYFPRIIIPLAPVGVALLDFAVASSVLLAMMLYYGMAWPLQILLAPVLLLGMTLLAVGVGALFAALNVAYRDFRYVIPFLVQIWLFVTPVVYPVSLVPERWQWVLFLNPMSGLIDGFRACFLGHEPDLAGLLVSCLTGALVFLAGTAYFHRVERRFADVV